MNPQTKAALDDLLRAVKRQAAKDEIVARGSRAAEYAGVPYQRRDNQRSADLIERLDALKVKLGAQ